MLLVLVKRARQIGAVSGSIFPVSGRMLHYFSLMESQDELSTSIETRVLHTT
jgi:hypothetical protein